MAGELFRFLGGQAELFEVTLMENLRFGNYYEHGHSEIWAERFFFRTSAQHFFSPQHSLWGESYPWKSSRSIFRNPTSGGARASNI